MESSLLLYIPIALAVPTTDLHSRFTHAARSTRLFPELTQDREQDRVGSLGENLSRVRGPRWVAVLCLGERRQP